MGVAAQVNNGYLAEGLLYNRNQLQFSDRVIG